MGVQAIARDPGKRAGAAYEKGGPWQLANGGFEMLEEIKGSGAVEPGRWYGAQVEIVGAVDPIVPADGGLMLHLRGPTSPDVGTIAEGPRAVQIVDARPWRSANGVASVTASASFNRAPGTTQRTAFLLELRAYPGVPNVFPHVEDGALAIDGIGIAPDEDPRTWEPATVSLLLPEKTEYVAVVVAAADRVSANGGSLRLAGHYVDGVRITVVPASVPFRRGDADGNWTFAMGDPLFLLRHLFANGDEPPCLDAADADDDGRLTTADAIASLAALFDSAGALPPPYDGCSVDATGDDLGCGAFAPCQ